MTNSSSKRRDLSKTQNSQKVDYKINSKVNSSVKEETIDVSAVSVESSKASASKASKPKESSNNANATKKSNLNNGGEFNGGAFTTQTKGSGPSKIGIALGMIETRGMVPAIEAADAMTKAAEVELLSRDFVGGGYVTVMVRGETGAVNASVRAGADACERVGDGLVAAHIIARPHEEIEQVLRPSKRRRGG